MIESWYRTPRLCTDINIHPIDILLMQVKRYRETGNTPKYCVIRFQVVDGIWDRVIVSWRKGLPYHADYNCVLQGWGHHLHAVDSSTPVFLRPWPWWSRPDRVQTWCCTIEDEHKEHAVTVYQATLRNWPGIGQPSEPIVMYVSVESWDWRRRFLIPSPQKSYLRDKK